MSRKTVRHYSGDLKYPEPVFKSVDFLWVSLQTNILHRTFFTLWAIPYLKKNWSFTLFSSSASNQNKMIWWNLPSAVEIVFKRKLRSALCYRFFGWFLLREREGANYVICINWLSINVQSAYYFITMTRGETMQFLHTLNGNFQTKKDPL